MESNPKIVQSVIERKTLELSNVFNKTVHSRLYESFHLQNSTTLSQGRNYDSEYRTGFPKLYAFDTAVQNRSNVSVDQKSRFSFRNANSQVRQQSSILIQQNAFLKSEISRLTTILQTQRRAAISRGEFDRLNALLNSRQAEIRQLREKIRFLEGKLSIQTQTSQWEIKYNESLTIINQLNIKITTLTQQIFQLEKAQTVPKVDPQVGILKTKIQSYDLEFARLKEQISQYQRRQSQYETQISSLQTSIWKLQEKSQQPVPLPPAPVVDDEKWLVEEGKLSLRIIILLQEINRLKQKEADLLGKSEDLHAYLLKAENYIEEIQTQLEKNNLKENIPAHIVEKITLLEEQNRKYTLLVEELQLSLSSVQTEGISLDEYYSKIGERDLRIIILLEEVNRLNQKYIEIRGHLQKAEDFIEELQYTLNNQQLIIPPEIEDQIRGLTQENNQLNVLIENYLTEIHNLKISISHFESRSNQQRVEYKVEFKTPPEIEAKIALLASQNDRLNRLILQLRNAPSKVQYKVQYKTQFKIPPEVEARIALLTSENDRLNRLILQLRNAPSKVQYKTQFKTEFKIPPEIEARLSLLASENQRLNRLINELRSQTAKIETRVEVTKDETLEKEYAKLQLRAIILLQEINRLNFSLTQVSQYLVNAENFIEQLEIRINEISNQPSEVQTKIETRVEKVVQYRVPEEIEHQLAKFTLRTIFLLEQINRLNSAVVLIRQHLVSAQNYIEQCEVRIRQIKQTVITNQTKTVEYRIPAQIETKLTSLTQQNMRLTILVAQLENKPARVQTRIETKYEYKLPPEFQSRLVLLTSQNQKLKTQVTKVKEVTIVKDVNLQAEYGKLQLRNIILLEEVNRLNASNEQFRQHLINAETYIEQIQNRPIQGEISPEIQAKIAFLAQQNERLKLEINKITLTYEQQIKVYVSQITSFKTQITSYLTQINNYKTEIHNYTVQIHQLESNSGVQQIDTTLLEKAEVEWGKEHLRAIILLEEINRLNAKLAIVESEKTEIVSHLINAQSFIEELERRYTVLEQSTKSSSVTTLTTTVQGSNSAIQELNSQIIELETKNKQIIAERDLKILFLQEQINRLNEKEKQLIIQLGGSRTLVSSSQQISELRREKEDCERQLQEVLHHLREAEEYIGQLLRQNQAFLQERDQLINELNNIHHRR